MHASSCRKNEQQEAFFFISVDLSEEKAKDYTEELRGFSLPSLQYKPKPFHRCLARNGVYRSLDRFASIEFLVQTAENDAQDCGGNDGN